MTTKSCTQAPMASKSQGLSLWTCRYYRTDHSTSDSYHSPPIHVSTFLPLILHDLNGQPYPKKALVKVLKEDVDRSLEEASDLSKQVGLSLPFYICEVLPRILCEDLENSDPFTYQLCPYFLPSVLCIHWTRINCGKIMLHAFINLCHHILHPHVEWKVRPPVGIRANSTDVNETALSLACAYLSLSLVSLSNCWKTTWLNQPEMPRCIHDRERLPSSWNSSMSSSCLKTVTMPRHSKTCTLSTTTCLYMVKMA